MTYLINVKNRTEREATITQRVTVSEDFGNPIYDFRSDKLIPKVISLPVDVPVYRMENCRTFSAQQTEVARDQLQKDFFEKGQEVTVAQQVQHKILVKLAKQGSDSVTPIISILEDDGQREEILITSTGVVVNGNRRLAAMRELKTRSDGSVDERFTNIKCAVLPPDVTRDEIDDIEADLQARPLTKLDYDWIGDANLLRRQVGKNRTIKNVANRLRRDKTDVENTLQALDEADLYLSEWVNKPGEYDLLQDGQQIFRDIPKAINKKQPNLQNASRAIAWSLYENRDKVTGRIYRFNAAFGKLAPKVLDILDSELEIYTDEDESIDEDDFSIVIDDDGENKDYTPIIKTLHHEDSKEDAVNVLIDACETVIELDKGADKEEAALKTLVQANSKLNSVEISTAGLKTIPSILKQIETMRKRLEKIEIEAKKRQT